MLEVDLATNARPSRRRIDVYEYARMGEIGIFGPEERVELIDGEIVTMMTFGPDHMGSVNGLTELLVTATVGRAIVSVQNPVVLDEYSELEPDCAVLRFREDRYRLRKPGPADILLLIEVAKTSISFDRAVKAPLYARAGVPELWVADLAKRVLEVYRLPVDGVYSAVVTYKPEDTVALSRMPDVRIPLALVFG